MPQKVSDMEWNVLYSNFNSKKIETYNVFNHSRFLKEVVKEAEKCKSKDEFLEELRMSLFYYYCAKSEWEVIVEPWVGTADAKMIDVYHQVMNNWHIFSEYICEKLNVH